MSHVGFEPSSVVDAFSSPRKFLELIWDFATIRGPRRAQAAYPRAKAGAGSAS